jgi:SagB-type dehydrogenase family enzyme
MDYLNTEEDMPDNETDLYLKAITFEWNQIDFSLTAQARKEPVPPFEKPYVESRALIKLPAMESIKKSAVSVLDALISRQSRRRFTDESLALDEIAILLYCTQGVKRCTKTRSFRTVPSAGARHALETYVYLERVSGIEAGLYRYLPLEHALILEKPFAPEMKRELNVALNEQLWNAAAYFIWTAVPYRMAWRYSSATAKLLALDAGHLCENLYLACEAIHCGTCAIGAYSQSKMNAFLGINGTDEFAIYMAPVGKI